MRGVSRHPQPKEGGAEVTPERVAELRALADAATPGPWEYGTAMCCPDMGWVDGPSGRVCGLATKSTHGMNAEDAEFCAASRTALPEALDEIERLRAENDELRHIRAVLNVQDWRGAHGTSK